jgi:hypothetical protein
MKEDGRWKRGVEGEMKNVQIMSTWEAVREERTESEKRIRERKEMTCRDIRALRFIAQILMRVVVLRLVTVLVFASGRGRDKVEEAILAGWFLRDAGPTCFGGFGVLQ